jgi:hypothetical protein
VGKLISFFRGDKPQIQSESNLLDMLKGEVDRKAARQIEQHYRQACRVLVAALAIALLGTMVPITAANIYFSVAATVITLALFAARAKLRIPKQTIAALILLACASITTGCSPLWADIDGDVLAVCQQTTEGNCRSGLAKGWSVLGIPVRFATIGQAQLNGGVDKVFGVETIRGVGLISVTRLTVYGG